MRALVEKMRAGSDLNSSEIGYAVSILLSEKKDPAEKAAFLAALDEKGESPEEIAGFVQHLIDRAISPELDPASLPGPMIDVCGTGGAGLEIFNVSTTIMFILAAGGAVVVKHGNHSVTSCCGSADVLQALGIRLDWPPAELRECVKRLGLGFIFARTYHPAFQALAEMRKQLALTKRRTIFNLLGPLLNPARPGRQLIGVYTPRMTRVFAEVLRQLGRERAWVVHGLIGEDAGMDDISTGGVTTRAELADGRVSSAVIDTRWLGIPEAGLDDLRGGDAAMNAQILTGILSGETQGAKRDLALVNAAGGFVAAGIARDMSEGIWLAKQQIESGRALEKLRALQEMSAL
ncbi:MAG: anthranilate phosphoribosyltransferase [Chthoniobacterales bacterium]